MTAIPHPPKDIICSAVEFPGAPIPLDSLFYIERPPLEARTYAEISKPGGLVRLKAPRKMGKSSLMLRIADQAAVLGYRTVTVDFQQADSAIFTSLDKFLRWVCTNIARQLEIEPDLDDYWDEDIGSSSSCSIYMKGYLLKQITFPLVLVLNEVNRVFEHPHIAQDFLPLLRFWYEQARQDKVWQKLRMVVIHSTEVYVTLNLNQSPFNVGLALKLSEFTPDQMQDLAQRYGLDTALFEPLMQMVGGHPYLVHLALYHLSCQDLTLDKLLQDAPTNQGIYSNHLRSLLATLQQRLELASAFKQVVTAPDSVCLDQLIADQLDSMGVVKLAGNACTVSCELYRLYFQAQNLDEEHLKSVSRLKQLEQENQKLKSLANVDELTQIFNRRYFNSYLQAEWERIVSQASPLSMIVAKIEQFKLYKEVYGIPASDNCLGKVAQAISQFLQRPGDLVARYNSEEFAIFMPETDATDAMRIAEKILERVEDLAIAFQPPGMGGLPSDVITLSLGVASTISNRQKDASILIQTAEKALNQAKREDMGIYLIQF
ncbi:AAA-like domain-containing protein [Microseira wollei]|uniref:Diguanylate cyclase n=1 Tax=Microseira wollei NIES-4236 TaxID=2530354 RepID=A0AAV3XI26_9CYAN|nr:AAA-like domain-containing protein [Microseira wollei]GET40154.1 diguanylate cyclase [Microseira wollei NIES-4236]